MRFFPSRQAAAWAALLFIVNVAAAQDHASFSRRNPVTEAVAKTKAAVVTQSVVNAFDVERSLWNTKPGDRVRLDVQREGKSLVIELTLVASTGAGRSADAQATDSRPVAEMPTAKIIGVGSER